MPKPTATKDAYVSVGLHPDGEKIWTKVGVVMELAPGVEALRLHVMPFPKYTKTGHGQIYIKLIAKGTQP